MVNLDFLSKECKNNNHGNCNEKWGGLGFQVTCICACHHNKKINKVSEVVPNSSSDPFLHYNDHSRRSRIEEVNM